MNKEVDELVHENKEEVQKMVESRLKKENSNEELESWLLKVKNNQPSLDSDKQTTQETLKTSEEHLGKRIEKELPQDGLECREEVQSSYLGFY